MFTDTAMVKRPMSVGVGVAAYRNTVHMGVVLQLCAMGVYATVHKLVVHINSVNSSSLDWARNMLLFQAVQQRADWCLFIDADTYLPKPELVFGMMAEGLRRNAAVIAAPVQMRGRDGFNVQVKNSDGSVRYLTEPEFRGQVIPVVHIGTAMMAIRCAWINDHWPWQAIQTGIDPAWFVTGQKIAEVATDKGPRVLPVKVGEDFAFCDGVLARGGSVLCDGRCAPAHAEATSETAVFVEHLGADIVAAVDVAATGQVIG